MHLPIIRWGLGWGGRGDRWGDRRAPSNAALGGVVPPRIPPGGVMPLCIAGAEVTPPLIISNEEWGMAVVPTNKMRIRCRRK